MKKNLLFIVISLLALGSWQQLNAQNVYAGSIVYVSREYNPYPESWAAFHVLGPPDFYPGYADDGRAWAPESYGDQRDTIDLEFDNAHPIDSILIWETYTPGYVDSVFIKNPGTGNWQLVYNAAPVFYGDSSRILRIGFPATAFAVSQVRIMLATDSADNYVELDAVAIHPVTPNSFNFVQSGLPGYAVQFNGDSSIYKTYAVEGNMLTDTAFTIAVWVNVSDTAPEVFSHYNGAGIVSDGDNGNLGIFLADLSGNADSIYFLAYPTAIAMAYTRNVWMHLAMTFDHDTLKAYRNDTLIGVAEGPLSWGDGDGPLEVGYNSYAGVGFKGLVDELVTFKRVLTQPELTTVKNIGLTGTEQGLTGYWQFNDCNSTTSSYDPITHLKVERRLGATCADADYVEVCGNLDAAFTSSGTGSVYAFANATVIAKGDTMPYLWNFGDPASGVANISSTRNPTHTFSAPGTYTVCLTSAAYFISKACTDSVCHTVTVTQTNTGLEVLNDDVLQLSIFPVPANDVLNIQASVELSTVEVYDMPGRLIYNAPAQLNKQTNIPLKDFGKGFYLLKVTTANATAVKRFSVE